MKKNAKKKKKKKDRVQEAIPKHISLQLCNKIYMFLHLFRPDFILDAINHRNRKHVINFLYKI